MKFVGKWAKQSDYVSQSSTNCCAWLTHFNELRGEPRQVRLVIRRL